MGTVAVQPHPRFWLLLCGPKSGALDRLRFRLLGEIMRGCPANARGGHTALSQATRRDPSHKLKDAVSHMSAFQLTHGKSETGSLGLVQSSQATIGELQGCPELSRYHWRALGLLPQSNGNSETGSPGLAQGPQATIGEPLVSRPSACTKMGARPSRHPLRDQDGVSMGQLMLLVSQPGSE